MKKLGTRLLTLKIASFHDLEHTVVFPSRTVCKFLFYYTAIYILISDKDMYATLLFIISSGVNQWRDQMKPSQILENLARLKGISPPQIAEDGSSLSFGGRDYSLQDLGILGVITTVCMYYWEEDM